MSRFATPDDDVIVFTGADQHFFYLLSGALNSLGQARQRHGFQLAVLDFGLTASQVLSLERDHQVRVVTPAWFFEPPAPLKTPRNLSYAVRSYLPRLVSGYAIYVWFDADAWVQDPGFLSPYLEPARRGKLAIVNEREPVYTFNYRNARWHYGNLFLIHAWIGGLRLSFARDINTGVLAMAGDHPAWDLWSRRYIQAMTRTGKADLDQHALLAAIELDGIDVHYLGGEHNWICSRGTPMYDEARGLFCKPYPPYEPINVMHLAGPSKRQTYEVPLVRGGSVRRQLLYPAAGSGGDRSAT